MSRARLVAALAAAALVVGAAGCGSDSSGDSADASNVPSEVTVPFLVALTGPAGIYAESLTNGVQMAVQEVNAEGGIGGQTKVNVEATDTQADPQKAVTAFTRLYSQEEFPFLLTSYSSQTKALLPIAEQRDVTMVNGGAQTDSLAGHTPTLYNAVPLIENETAVLAPYLVEEKGFKTAAILNADDDSGKDAADDFAEDFEAAGGSVVARATGGFDATDFRSQLTKLRASNPDVLFLGALGAAATAMIDQTRELGWDVPLANTSWVEVPEILEAPSAEGLIFTSFGFNPPKQFVDAYEERFGNAPDTFAGNFYDAAKALFVAYETAVDNGYSLDAEGIGKALDEISFQSSYGHEVDFGENGVINRPLDIAVVENGKAKIVEQNAGGN